MPKKSAAEKLAARRARAHKRDVKAALKAGAPPPPPPALPASGRENDLSSGWWSTYADADGVVAAEDGNGGRRLMFGGYKHEDGDVSPASFDAKRGVFLVNQDGLHDVSCASKEAPPSDTNLWLTITSGTTGANSFHAVPAPPLECGMLLHLRTGDQVSVQVSTGKDVAAPRCAVTLRVGLAQRKRKRRRDDIDDAGSSSGHAKKKQKRRGKRVAKAKAAAAAPATAMLTLLEDGDGSDTEWEDGFSSDSDTALERREARRILRGTRLGEEEGKKKPGLHVSSGAAAADGSNDG